jgi:F-type H+-transporting ATPase subunit delta
MKTVRQLRRESRQLFRLCLVDGKVDEDIARRVVRAILQSRRRGYLVLLKHFQRLLRLEYARHTAEIESAVPLAADLRASVQNGLEHLYGQGITALFAQNPKLIGGMRIRIGSDVFDGSVQGELAELERSFGITSGNGRTS